jgi:hypothetical protein
MLGKVFALYMDMNQKNLEVKNMKKIRVEIGGRIDDNSMWVYRRTDGDNNGEPGVITGRVASRYDGLKGWIVYLAPKTVNFNYLNQKGE